MSGKSFAGRRKGSARATLFVSQPGRRRESPGSQTRAGASSISGRPMSAPFFAISATPRFRLISNEPGRMRRRARGYPQVPDDLCQKRGRRGRPDRGPPFHQKRARRVEDQSDRRPACHPRRRTGHVPASPGRPCGRPQDARGMVLRHGSCGQGHQHREVRGPACHGRRHDRRQDARKRLAGRGRPARASIHFTLYPPRLRVPRRRPASDELPPAPIHPADARVRLRRI